MVNRIAASLKLGIGLFLLASLCSAAGSIASVTSAEPFSVDGITLSNPGVSTWPLISSDEIATTSAGALLTFRDGSAIQMAAQSRIKLTGSESAPEVLLIAGNLQTKLAPGSRLVVTRASAASDKEIGQDTNTGAAPPNPSPSTGAARPNNNTPFRKAAFLYFISAVSLAGLGIAIDAILQPGAVSAR